MAITTLNDFVQPVVKLLGNRSDIAALAPQQIADSIIELSNNYPFEQLRETGDTVQFTPGQNKYEASFFLKAGRKFNKVISWFFYLQPPVSLVTTPSQASNPGYNLRYRDIEDMETLTNTLSLPTYWSQLGQSLPFDTDDDDPVLYVAAAPTQAYYTYVRYQYLHPFSYPAQTSDEIFLPTNWYDIAQYAAAERIALQLRMQDVADRYHKILFGDPEFERSSGGRGQPGLIARRISQTQKNQARATRSIRLIGRGVY